MSFADECVWSGEFARELASRAANTCARHGLECPRELLMEVLAPVIGAPAIGRWLEHLEGAKPTSRSAPSALDALVPDGLRRHDGIFFTPIGLADGMASCVGERPGWIVDPSAGDGALLSAAVRARPASSAWGVELHEPLAVGAALALWDERARQGAWPARPLEDRVVVGDGLSLENAPTEGVVCVIGNPPYMGEKGRAARFGEVRAAHPDLAARMIARGDLLYLFMHRAMDLLEEGGVMVFVTSEYWLSATGARALREDLTTRGHVSSIYGVEGAGVFVDAPGHHTLVLCVERASGGAREGTRVGRSSSPPEDWAVALRAAGESGRPVTLPAQGEPWSPWASARDERWRVRFEASGERLEALLCDRQGFVSGADRLSARRRRALEDAGVEELPAVGSPIFMAPAGELPDELRDAGLVRPVLRGREVVAGRVLAEASGLEEEALYIDGELEGEGLEAATRWLEPYKPLLEARREVGSGRMPWYRMHWPRDGAEQRGPKLVSPRRAPGPCFMLDLSGAGVSSDCTYLVAPAWVEEPERHLARLMLLLNAAPVAWYLKTFGKRKGVLVELYSEPLRGVTLPARREGHEVVPAGWCEGAGRWSALIESADLALEGAILTGSSTASWNAGPSAFEALGEAGENG